MLKILCSLAALIGVGCKKLPEGKGDLALRFHAVFDQEPVVLYTSKHRMPDNDTFQLQVLQLFVSELALVNEQNDTVRLGDPTYFLDCSKKHSTLQGAQEGEAIELTKVPAGNYKKILLSIGVAAPVNAKEPGDFTTASPLGDVSNYCSIRESYIFSKLEGRLTTTTGNVRSFMYHSGSNAMYQTIALDKIWSIKDQEQAVLHLDIDLQRVFYPVVGTPIDIETRFATGPDENGTQLALDVIRNLAKALTIH